jgi:hypothetical protein
MGAHGSFNLTPEPLVEGSQVRVRVELNQWIHFDKPRKYRVTASSSRACMIVLAAGEFPTWLPPNQLDLTSNPIEVEIVAAEPEWQRSQLERIVGVLPADRSVWELAYLETDEALQEIRKRLAASDGHMDTAWQFAQNVFLQLSSTRPAH